MNFFSDSSDGNVESRIQEGRVDRIFRKAFHSFSSADAFEVTSIGRVEVVDSSIKKGVNSLIWELCVGSKRNC